MTESPTRSTRIPALDWIKAAAIIAVAITHGAPNLWVEGLSYGPLLITAVTTFHVPTFLMVAGFLAGADTPLGARHVAERLLRLVPPYLVAVAVTWAIGWVQFPTPRRFVFKLVTGAALGHFYFVPVLASCFILLPILSRATATQLTALLTALAVVAEVMWIEPAWRLSKMMFWQFRDPLVQFHFGNFVLGVLAARHYGAIARTMDRSRVTVATVAGAGMLGMVGLAVSNPLWIMQPLTRPVYTVAVIAFIAACTPRTPAPRLVRFLSETTLTVYLYHWFVYPPLQSVVAPLPLGVRALALAAAGVTFGSVVALAGRRLLGRHSRTIVGA